MHKPDAMVPAGAGELSHSRCVDCMGLIGIGFSLSNPLAAQIHHAVRSDSCQSSLCMRAGYIKLKSSFTVCFRDIVMEGWSD
jgi:hypothetical protein